jgi:hypothetical protein
LNLRELGVYLSRPASNRLGVGGRRRLARGRTELEAATDALGAGRSLLPW